MLKTVSGPEIDTNSSAEVTVWFIGWTNINLATPLPVLVHKNYLVKLMPFACSGA